MKQNSTSTTAPLLNSRVERELEQTIEHSRIEEYIEDLKQRIRASNQEAGAVLAQTTALDEFQRFFAAYAEYFQEPVNQQSANYAIHVLAASLENTRSLFNALVRAISQRLTLDFDFANDDAIAAQLFERINTRLFSCFNDATGSHQPITHYEKRYHITRSLFPSHPLIAIPLDLINVQSPIDPAAAAVASGSASFGSKTAAIAHELGHYLFNNSGRITEYQRRIQTLHQAISKDVLAGLAVQISPVDPIDVVEQQTDFSTRFEVLHTWLGWLEEVCADIVGTLLHGPLYALSAQDVLTKQINTVADLTMHDGRHPTPSLRPRIAQEVLNYIGRNSINDNFKQAMEATVTALDERWSRYAEGIEQNTTEPHFQSEEHQLMCTPDPMERYLGQIVEIILSTPLTYQPDSKDSCSLLQAIRYWGQDETPEELAELVSIQQAVQQESALAGSFVPGRVDTAMTVEIADIAKGDNIIPEPIAVSTDNPLFDLVEEIGRMCQQSVHKYRIGKHNTSDGYSSHLHDPPVEHKHCGNNKLLARIKGQTS